MGDNDLDNIGALIPTTPKHEGCKLIWKLQTDIKIANRYENCKAILTFWCIVPMQTFAIFIWDTAGMKTCSGTERMFPFNCGVDDKSSTKQSLAKPSTIHILIPIPMLTLSHDSSALFGTTSQLCRMCHFGVCRLQKRYISFNSLTAKSFLTGEKLVLFGKYVLNST